MRHLHTYHKLCQLLIEELQVVDLYQWKLIRQRSILRRSSLFTNLIAKERSVEVLTVPVAALCYGQYYVVVHHLPEHIRKNIYNVQKATSWRGAYFFGFWLHFQGIRASYITEWCRNGSCLRLYLEHSAFITFEAKKIIKTNTTNSIPKCCNL